MRTPLFALLALTAACDSQVDAPYQGEALVSLNGTVENNRTQPTDAADVIVLWSADETALAGDRAEIEGSFPSNFQLRVYEKPDEAAISRYSDGSAMSVGFLLAVKPGVELGEQTAESDLMGMDPNHLLVYLPAGVQPGSTLSTILRGTPKAGFHVYDVHHLSEAEKESRATCRDGLPPEHTLQQLYDTCGGHPLFDDFLMGADLDTMLEVDLVDDFETIDFPNWT